MVEKNKIAAPLVKIVYFDEESASDLLDITAGGKEASSKESARERTAEVEAKAGAKAAAKFNWLPFFGGSAEAGAAASATALGRSILNKTLSNTILTDYLGKVHELKGVERLEKFTISAPSDSAAYMKMFTPYLAMLKIDELPVNLAELDKALLSAKGYYELLGQTPNGSKLVLRFNIEAFRNNYGLVDLGRMNLVFDGVRVGRASESSLTMSAEMNPNPSVTPVDALAIVDGSSEAAGDLLDVYDVILAGVEYAG
ncbi:DUF6414 family protein [Rathayibacter sp. SD072]|uniref:DUF6414 family protein n=1 Tax=Rathayibacter sp. SD072 TaxID=2781731 RepID=UPI001A97C75E|nr:DUF6414 family protein [Rathayibacter sp. SD072]MBO0983654.1 hypothetical protein [Rathayibacter sp. SD072]